MTTSLDKYLLIVQQYQRMLRGFCHAEVKIGGPLPNDENIEFVIFPVNEKGEFIVTDNNKIEMHSFDFRSWYDEKYNEDVLASVKSYLEEIDVL